MTQPVSEASRMVGAVLSGRYRLTRLLGEGGMGAVFAATNPSGDAVCAVKVLGRDFVDDADVKSRFHDEARAAARLTHPGIVRVYDAASAEDGTPYIVMELLEGRSLAALLAPRVPLPPAYAVAITRGLFSALGFAHQQGIVHRDLKPENVFVSGTDAAPVVKVLDFGLAKVMDAAGGMGKRTRTGMLLGTPGYMAPEQVADARSADARSDLFSIAVMLFEMLTATDPYPSTNAFEKLTKVLTSEAPSITAVAPHLAQFEAFFLRALAREPSARFASARDADEALAAAAGYAHGNGAPSMPPSSAIPRPEHTTQMSRMRPEDTPAPRPAFEPDQIQVVPASSIAKPRSMWPIVVVVIALLCLAIGVAVGVLVARG